MEKKVKKSRLAEVPAWALSVLTLVAIFILLKIFGDIDLHRDREGLGPILTIGPVTINEIIDIISFLVLIPIACFFICRLHPKSIWYTPVICNALAIVTILAAFFQDFSTTPSSQWVWYVSTIVIPVVAAILGARIGRHKTNPL